MMKAILKTWPATPVDASLDSSTSYIKLSRSCSLTEQPGSVGHLRNADWFGDVTESFQIRNLKSEFETSNLRSEI